MQSNLAAGALVGALLVSVSTCTRAAESFTPCFKDLLAVRLTVIDSHAAPIACIAASIEHGHVADAIVIALPLLIGAPVAACAIGTRTGATIIAPISPGPGWALAALGLMTPDELLGHELAHLAGLRHPAWLPMIDLGCEVEPTTGKGPVAVGTILSTAGGAEAARASEAPR